MNSQTMQTITVHASGGRAYPVQVGSGVLAQVAQFAADHNVLITTPPVQQLYAEAVLAALQQAGKQALVLTVPDGEASKNLDSVAQLIGAMLAEPLQRDGAVLALGGGVIGDIAGFVAAIYMRGVPVIQLPTTLLAQVDAAIGGKTGVNHPCGKNLIGAFHQPRAVLADTAVLASLPPREYQSGLAEVVKYGLLADADFFALLEAEHAAIMRRDPAILQTVISRSAQLKADTVAADETEQTGARALLNLGHTFAHAIETVSGYGVYLHGEAVAMGLVLAAELSQQVSDFTAADTARIRTLLAAFSLPTALPDSLDSTALLAAMQLDKKNSGGNKRFILMHRIGSAYIGSAADEVVLDVLEQQP